MREKRVAAVETEKTCSNADHDASAFSADQVRKRRRLLTPVQPNPQITFQDFRAATILKHPSFSFLGPASMAVYWFKVYLKSDNFRWIHHDSPPRQDRRKRTYFCHIPGQYLCPLIEDNRSNDESKFYSAHEVLERGTPNIHYAMSYVGVYNMIRKYGIFALDDQGDLVLVDYVGPPLPSVDQS